MLNLGIALGARNPAQWWPEGALYAADFGENRYMADGAPIAANAAFTLTRASGKRAADSRGNWLAFGANQPARTDLGVLLEPAAENGLPNTALEGAALSTTNMLDGLPTGWSRNKIDGTGFAARIVSLDTWLGLPALTVRLWGNSTVGDAQIVFASIASMTAVAGDTILESLFVQRIAGSTNNISPRLRLTEQDAGGIYLNKQLYFFTPQAGATRESRSFTVANAAAARATMVLEFSCSGAFDLTLRIAAPQMVKTAWTNPTSPIIASGSTGSRAADAMVLNLPEEACDVTLSLANGASLMLEGVSGATALDPTQFGAVPLQRAVAMPAA